MRKSRNALIPGRQIRALEGFCVNQIDGIAADLESAQVSLPFFRPIKRLNKKEVCVLVNDVTLPGFVENLNAVCVDRFSFHGDLL